MNIKMSLPLTSSETHCVGLENGGVLERQEALTLRGTKVLDQMAYKAEMPRKQ